MERTSIVKALAPGVLCLLGVVAVGVTWLWGPPDVGRPPDPAAAEITTEAVGLGFRFDHPPDLQVTSESNRSIELCVRSEQGSRHPRCVWLGVDDEPFDDRSAQRLSLDHGGTFDYVLESTTGGSGGVEHALRGRLIIDGLVVSVRANAADEAGFADATWPLSVVRSVRS